MASSRAVNVGIQRRFSTDAVAGWSANERRGFPQLIEVSRWKSPEVAQSSGDVLSGTTEFLPLAIECQEKNTIFPSTQHGNLLSGRRTYRHSLMSGSSCKMREILPGMCG
jgi:hypothetical protein